MKSFLVFLISLMPLGGFCQGVTLKPGDQFPAIPLDNLINSSTPSININQQKDKKIDVLNFWGT